MLEAVFTSKITPIYNDEILTEYAEVLSRDKFYFSRDLVTTLIQSLRDNGISVERISTGETLIDPNDLVFYEVCLAKQNEFSFLVTGNLKHFPKKPFIVSPQELMKILEA